MRSIPISEAAREMSVSETWVRRALHRGALRGHKAGRAVRVFVESIEEYQRGNQIGTGPANEATKPRAKRPVTARHQRAVAALENLL